MEIGISYSLLLILHLLAVAVFAGGLLVIAFTLPSFGVQAAPGRVSELRRLLQLNRFAVMPALILVWVLGISLAVEGGWFAAPWLHAKIGLVVLLSGLHGYQSGRLRRLAKGTPLARGYGRWWPWLIAAVLVVIIALVTGKPG